MKPERIIDILYPDESGFCKKFLVNYWQGKYSRSDSAYAVCRKRPERILYGFCTSVIKKEDYKYFKEVFLQSIGRVVPKQHRHAIKSTFAKTLESKYPVSFYILHCLAFIYSGKTTSVYGTSYGIPEIIEKFIDEKLCVSFPRVKQPDIFYIAKRTKTLMYVVPTIIDVEFEIVDYIDDIIYFWKEDPQVRFVHTIRNIVNDERIYAIDLVIAAYVLRLLTMSHKIRIFVDPIKIERYTREVAGGNKVIENLLTKVIKSPWLQYEIYRRIRNHTYKRHLVQEGLKAKVVQR